MKSEIEVKRVLDSAIASMKDPNKYVASDRYVVSILSWVLNDDAEYYQTKPMTFPSETPEHIRSQRT